MNKGKVKSKKVELKWPVVIIPGIIFITMIIAGYIDPVGLNTTLTDAFMSMMYNTGWFISLSMLFFMGVCVFVILSPIGNIRLGGPNAKPKMSTWQWFAIALTAGIGAGVVFWGAAEPLIFTMEPAPSLGFEPGSNEAILWGMRTVFLHWTLTPYSICVVIGITLAYVCYNMGLPYKVSSGLVPIFGRKFITSKWATAVDMISVIALIGGIAGGFGYGILQLSQGLKLTFGIEPSNMVYIIVGLVLFAGMMSGEISGLKKGIAWIGDQNTQLFFVLLIFMFLVGPIGYTLNLATESIGTYFNHLIEAMTYTAPYPNGELWPQWWDMYWWIDWMAFGPLSGLLFVRLAYGRTLREFAVVNWVLPAIFGFVWFSIFGGTVLHGQFFEGIDYYSTYKQSGAEALTLEVMGNMPFGNIARIFMMLIITLSLVTQGGLTGTLSSSSMKESSEAEEAPAGLKLFWGIVLIGVALVSTLTGGIEGIKMVKSFCGLPAAILTVLMIAGFLKYMAHRPRNAAGEYVYEDYVANAPDSGEEPSKPSKLIQAIISRMERSKQKNTEQ